MPHCERVPCQVEAAAMPRKADQDRRSTRRRSAAATSVDPVPRSKRTIPAEPKPYDDTDFGLCMMLAPALRRRNDA